VVRNVVALVTEDKALDINLGKKGHSAIQGIIGYPILAAERSVEGQRGRNIRARPK
jgi:hypothetical protein